MPAFYFSYFPKIPYGPANNVCLNITRNVSIANDVKGQAVLYYPFTIQAGLRPDTVASSYYKDPYFEWLIYKTNGIIDPYYGWYLNENDFNNFIVQKYGSIANSQQHVHYYQVAWSDDYSMITPAQYYTQIPQALKKYYVPIFGQGTQVLSFQRSRDDWTAVTNQIVRISTSTPTNNGYITGELVVFQSNGVTVGNAEVIVANSSVLKVQHVFGNVTANTSTIVGLTSNAQSTLQNAFIADYVVPLTEFALWTPVFNYDWERAKNEANKQIYLIDARVAPQLATQLRLDMKAVANQAQ